MYDRLKFRMYDTNVNKMYMPNDFEEVESIYECIKQQINWDLDVDYDIKFNHLENGRFFMKCTGLKDKNGKLIYEGDIVEVINCRGVNAVVEYNLEGAKFILKGEKFAPSALQHIRRDYFEVIGNIYENPELSEG